MGAARFWVRGAPAVDASEPAAALRAMGASPAVLAELHEGLRHRAETDVFPVLPPNWPACRLFGAMSTQWRLAPTGHRYGLDYSAIPTVMALLGLRGMDRQNLFLRLRILESAALEAMA